MQKILEYRRQFLLSRQPIDYFNSWNHLTLRNNLNLYCHPDLEVVSLKDSKKSIALLGLIFDPSDDRKSNEKILNDIINNVNTFEDLILYIKKYSGRYIFLYIDDSSSNVLSDALGLREIYYCTQQNNNIICGSQPNLVNNFANPALGISSDSEIKKFYREEIEPRQSDYAWWIGDETYYKDIKHLLPNHYLDIKALTSNRYWPNKLIKEMDLDEAVEISCQYLKVILKSITSRYSSMMAITAGLDSRTLLASSKELKNRVYFFINKEKHLKNTSPDIKIPYNISKKLNFDFHIHEIENEVDEHFKEIFLNNTFLSSERIITTIYNIYFKKLSNRLNICGVGEIGRTRYGEPPKKLDGHYLAYKCGYEKSEYGVKQCNKWLDDNIKIAQEYNLNILTLFYWEQKLGNWGTVGNSESDIAIEEVNPYNSHYLFEVFLSVNRKYTKYDYNILFRRMIKEMWPELLEFPINPPNSIIDFFKFVFRRIGIYQAFKLFKYKVLR